LVPRPPRGILIELTVEIAEGAGITALLIDSASSALSAVN
jgi:hypothetical protein